MIWSHGRQEDFFTFIIVLLATQSPKGVISNYKLITYYVQGIVHGTMRYKTQPWGASPMA